MSLGVKGLAGGDAMGASNYEQGSDWGEPERAPSLTSSMVALSVWYVGLFGPWADVFV